MDRTETENGHAVVLGGSIAGLLAARVLTEAFDQVTIIERDSLTNGSGPRRGVPQGRHIHALVAQGQRLLEQLFPGLTAELTAAGAPKMDLGRDVAWHLQEQRLCQADSDLMVLSASRPLLEDRLRRRVVALPNVGLVDNCDITGVGVDRQRGRVRGVHIFRRVEHSVPEEMAADLAVDCTGRGSRTPVWLSEYGYPAPSEDRVAIDLGYASQIFRLRPGVMGSDLAVIAGFGPGHHRGGALAKIEGDRWILTLGGILGDHPPTDADGLMRFARSVTQADLGDRLRGAEPVGEPAAFRFPASVRRRYDRLRAFPDGLIVLGDAQASFNPVYGQGITTAGLQALALQRLLQRGTVRPRDYFRHTGRALDAPWSLATGGDRAMPELRAARSPMECVMGAYLDRLTTAATADPHLSRAFLRVTGLIDPPAALLSPSVVAKVLVRRRGSSRLTGPARSVTPT